MTDSTGMCTEAEGMSLAQRLEAIRQARGYIQQQKVTGLGHKVVTHDYLLQLVRPLFIMWGVRWKPVSAEMLSESVIKIGEPPDEKVYFTELMRWTFRFKRTEDSDTEASSRTQHYEDVVVISRGLDRQAKDAGGSQTYAEKYAIFAIMNLGRGDDPDLTPVDLSPDIPVETEERVRQIRAILDADDNVPDTDIRLREICAGWAEKYSRKVRNIYSLNVKQLDQTIEQLKRGGKS